MTRINNPSLRLTPRHEPGEIIPTKQETSILEWLEASGRMMPREPEEEETNEDSDDLDIENNYTDAEDEQEGDQNYEDG